MIAPSADDTRGDQSGALPGHPAPDDPHQGDGRHADRADHDALVVVVDDPGLGDCPEQQGIERRVQGRGLEPAEQLEADGIGEAVALGDQAAQHVVEVGVALRPHVGRQHDHIEQPEREPQRGDRGEAAGEHMREPGARSP